jgi:hypothetical protein
VGPWEQEQEQEQGRVAGVACLRCACGYRYGRWFENGRGNRGNLRWKPSGNCRSQRPVSEFIRIFTLWSLDQEGPAFNITSRFPYPY